MVVSTNAIKCNCCGRTKKDGEFYVSQSHFNKNTGKLNVCKQCVWDHAEKDTGDLILVKETLRMIDKPFISDIWKASEEESERTGKKLFRTYMKNIVMNKYKDMNWGDSIFKYQSTIQTLDGDVTENDDITEVINTWGRGKLDWEYEYLENEKFNLESSFECPDYGMEMIMKDICFINLDIEKLRQENNPNNQKAITNLIEARSKLMNSANMNPIQATGAEANDQITFGTLIKKWENEKPIPKPIDNEMKEYIDTFMVGHLAKMEGLTNDLTEKYDKALSKYTIEFSEINKDKDEEIDE